MGALERWLEQYFTGSVRADPAEDFMRAMGRRVTPGTQKVLDEFRATFERHVKAARERNPGAQSEDLFKLFTEEELAEINQLFERWLASRLEAFEEDAT
jgi:hypothetical protein